MSLWMDSYACVQEVGSIVSQFLPQGIHQRNLLSYSSSGEKKEQNLTIPAFPILPLQTLEELTYQINKIYYNFIMLYHISAENITINRRLTIYINYPQNYIMIDLFSSLIASTISTTALYPAERIKIQMQLDSQNNGLLHSIYNCYNKNSLYKGLTSLIIGNAISYGVYFVSYQKAKQFIISNKQVSTGKVIICSGVAGVMSSLLSNPFWVLQTRQAYENMSMTKSGKKLIQQEGIFSLWKGINSSIILVINPIIQFCIYEFLKKKLKIDQKHKLYDLMIFIIGAISKLISTLITYPYTVIRTKQHVNQSKDSMPIIIKRIYNDSNFAGFYKGLTPKLIQTVLNSSLMLMLYEKIKRIIQKLVI